EDDCGTRQGVRVPIAEEIAEDTFAIHELWETSASGRVVATDVKDSEGKVVAEAGADLTGELTDKLVKAGIPETKVRSVLTCQTPAGVRAQCSGAAMASGPLVDIGAAGGVVA